MACRKGVLEIEIAPFLSLTGQLECSVFCLHDFTASDLGHCIFIDLAAFVAEGEIGVVISCCRRILCEREIQIIFFAQSGIFDSDLQSSVVLS